MKYTAKLSKKSDDVDANNDVDSKKTRSFFKSKKKLFDKSFLKRIKDTAELSTHLKEADHPYANKIYQLIEETINKDQKSSPTP